MRTLTLIAATLLAAGSAHLQAAESDQATTEAAATPAPSAPAGEEVSSILTSTPGTSQATSPATPPAASASASKSTTDAPATEEKAKPPTGGAPAAKEKDNFAVPHKYRAELRGNETVYCSKETEQGSRFKKKTCFNLEELKYKVALDKANADDLTRRARVCGSAGACSSN